MPAEAKLVNLRVGEIELRSEWNDSPTAELLYEALPLSASGSYWGGEIYFDVPVNAPAEPDATDVVEPGTIAYWPWAVSMCLLGTDARERWWRMPRRQRRQHSRPRAEP